MAEAITYADLRFVKAPLKKSNSRRLGHDPETDEDGELTYENVPPGTGGPSSLASSGLAGAQSEQPTAAWSPVTSPAAGRILWCHAACMRYLVLGLLLTCLLCAVAATCLGVRYSCCPLGWIQNERSCFYISVTKRSWLESQSHCKSLSSDLAKTSDSSQSNTISQTYIRNLRKVVPQGGSAESYWVGPRNRFWQPDHTKYSWYPSRIKCPKLETKWMSMDTAECQAPLPSICEMSAFRSPDGDHSLH